MLLNKKKILANIDPQWMRFIDLPELDTVLEQLDKFDIDDFTPHPSKWFDAFRKCPFEYFVVILIGQDPYPRRGDANGLCFSCNNRFPASFNWIYKALKKSKLLHSKEKTADLSSWAKQGVLMLNAGLSTEVNKMGAHLSIWQPYMRLVLNRISQLSKRQTVAAILWGRKAQIFASKMHKDVVKFTYKHPSPSANTAASGNFDECPNFLDVNKLLKENDIEPIIWDPSVEIDYDDYDDNADDDIQNTILDDDLNTQSTILDDAKSYEPETPAEFLPSKFKHIVFTDGSCYPNKKCKEAKAGYAILFASGPSANRIMYGNIANDEHFATNQRAEGIAILKTLQYLSKKQWTELVIVTDSEFWIKMINYYMPNWKKKNKKFKNQANPDITIPLYKLHKKLSQLKNITFKHMKSHDKDGWSKYPEGSYQYYCYCNNDYVDQLAGYARETVDVGENVVDISVPDEED